MENKSKTVTLDKAIDLLYDNDHKPSNARKPWTIKWHDEIPLDFFDLPDLSKIIEVKYNESSDNYVLHVDELIEKVLEAKSNLTEKESYVLKLATENRKRREKSEDDAGEDL